jgi:hypothetical protein
VKTFPPDILITSSFSSLRKMKFLFMQWLLLACTVAGINPNVRGTERHFSRKIIPSTVFNGSVDANTVSTESNLDGPQLSAVNSTSYEWWYFDAVSPDLESAITIVFYTALSSGFGLLPPSSDVAVISMDFLFPNGTSRSIDLAATEAVITTIDQGSSAVYKGAGAQWQGAPDLSSYIVSIDSPKSGVVGTFKLKSRAPAQ